MFPTIISLQNALGLDNVAQQTFYVSRPKAIAIEAHKCCDERNPDNINARALFY